MKKNAMELKAGMVVQLSPDVGNYVFACCMMIITEPKDFGAQGYVQTLGGGKEFGGQAYYRAMWEEMEYVGEAKWIAE